MRVSCIAYGSDKKGALRRGLPANGSLERVFGRCVLGWLARRVHASLRADRGCGYAGGGCRADLAGRVT